MTRKVASFLLASALLGASPLAMAEPGGCVKYGAAGAVAGHLASHGVIGAVGGCAAGMYQRHKYRKANREKAALWDKEHPDQRSSSGWLQHESKDVIAQKAQWYDQEHEQTPNAPAPK